jgi:hypothetical protein
MALCDLASPFHLHPEAPPVMVQGHPLPALPYAMGNRIFWTMVLPLVPIFLMVFGHEAWRRICPLSHFSQIPHLLGWQRKIKALNCAQVASSGCWRCCRRAGCGQPLLSPARFPDRRRLRAPPVRQCGPDRRVCFAGLFTGEQTSWLGMVDTP